MNEVLWYALKYVASLLIPFHSCIINKARCLIITRGYYTKLLPSSLGNLQVQDSRQSIISLKYYTKALHSFAHEHTLNHCLSKKGNHSTDIWALESHKVRKPQLTSVPEPIYDYIAAMGARELIMTMWTWRHIHFTSNMVPRQHTLATNQTILRAVHVRRTGACSLIWKAILDIL